MNFLLLELDSNKQRCFTNSQHEWAFRCFPKSPARVGCHKNSFRKTCSCTYTPTWSRLCSAFFWRINVWHTFQVWRFNNNLSATYTTVQSQNSCVFKMWTVKFAFGCLKNWSYLKSPSLHIVTSWIGLTKHFCFLL